VQFQGRNTLNSSLMLDTRISYTISAGGEPINTFKSARSTKAESMDPTIFEVVTTMTFLYLEINIIGLSIVRL